jgi:sulfoxide reductase heme-binding subunit YedZ
MRAGKNDFAEVGVYAFVLAALLGSRLWHFLNKKGHLVAFLPQHGR